MHLRTLTSVACLAAFLSPVCAQQFVFTVDPAQSSYVGRSVVNGTIAGADSTSAPTPLGGQLVVRRVPTPGGDALRIVSSELTFDPYGFPVTILLMPVPFDFGGTVAFTTPSDLPLDPSGAFSGGMTVTGIDGGSAETPPSTFGDLLLFEFAGQEAVAQVSGTLNDTTLQLQGGAGFLDTDSVLGQVLGANSFQILNFSIVATLEAAAFPARESCAPIPRDATSYRFVPSGAGYQVVDGGTPDLDFALGGNVSDGGRRFLPFGPSGFAFPGGVISDEIRISMHGVVQDADVNRLPLMPPIEIAALNAASAPSLMPFATALTGGDVWFHTGAGFASVTWDQVVQPAGSDPITFQCILRDDDSFEFHYLDADGLTNLGSGESLLVGFSAGMGVVNPGSCDLTGLPTTAVPVLYEDFGLQGGAASFDAGASALSQVDMVAVTQPVLGTDFQVDVRLGGAAAGATDAIYLLGVSSDTLAASLPLGILSPDLASCQLLVDLVTPGALLATAIGPIGSPTTIVSLPGNPAFDGISGLSVQALAIAPGSAPGLLPTNELAFTLGF